MSRLLKLSIFLMIGAYATVLALNMPKCQQLSGKSRSAITPDFHAKKDRNPFTRNINSPLKSSFSSSIELPIKVSLDRAIIPGIVMPPKTMQKLDIGRPLWGIFIALILLSVPIIKETAGVYYFVGEFAENIIGVIKSALSCSVASILQMAAIIGDLVTFPDSLIKRLLHGDERSHFTIDTWTRCKLSDIESIDSDFNKYTFEFPGHTDVNIDLDIGQQVTLCCADAKGKVLKQGFFPVALTAAAASSGRFAVIARRGAFLGTGEDFALALQFMEVGDEMAVKKGERLLRMGDAAPEGPGAGANGVQSVAILAAGLGILPCLQLLRTVQQDPDSSVNNIELLWINDGKRDFVLNKDVEEVERSMGNMINARGSEGSGVGSDGNGSGRLSVTRVVDRELGNANTLINKDLHAVIDVYKVGALGLVLAEGVAAEKLQKLLKSRGYPESSIVRLREPQLHYLS